MTEEFVFFPATPTSTARIVKKRNIISVSANGDNQSNLTVIDNGTPKVTVNYSVENVWNLMNGKEIV